MQLGLDSSTLSPGLSGGLVPWLEGLLGAALEQEERLQLTLFDPRAEPPILRGRPRVSHCREFPQRTSRMDVLLRSYPSPLCLEFPTQRQILFVPDLQHERCPHFFTACELQERRRNFWYSLARCQAVVSLSEFSRGTISQHPMARRKEVVLCPPGASSPEPRPADPGQSPYFLYPANLWPHKNHGLVLQAFQRFARRNPGARLLLTGETFGKWPELRREVPGADVEHLGYVGRERLKQLLAHCKALIFFSQYEGFGMPVLEAFAAGVPVACSNTTALAEVAGNAALTCSPLDVEAMAGAMQSLWSEPELVSELVRAGKQRVLDYSGSASAARLLELCARLARQPGHRPASSEGNREEGARSAGPGRHQWIENFIEQVGPWGHRALSELMLVEPPLQALRAEYLRQRRGPSGTPAGSLSFAEWVQEHNRAQPLYQANPQYRRAALATSLSPAELLQLRPTLFLGHKPWRSLEWLAFYLGLPGEVILAYQDDDPDLRTVEPELERRVMEQNPLDTELFLLAEQRFEQDYQKALAALTSRLALRPPQRRIFTAGEAWPVRGVYPSFLDGGPPLAWSGAQACFHVPVLLETRAGQRLHIQLEVLAQAPGVGATLSMGWNGEPVETMVRKDIGNLTLWRAVTRPLRADVPGGVHHLEVQSERRLCPPDTRTLGIALRRLSIGREA